MDYSFRFNRMQFKLVFVDNERGLCVKDLLDQVKVGSRLLGVGRLPGVLGLHNPHWVYRQNWQAHWNRTKPWEKDFPATLPASLIILALDVGTLTNKRIGLQFLLLF